MKRYITCLSIALLSALFFSCKSTSEAFSQTEVDELRALIEAKSLKIESEWAMPLFKNSVNQIANAGLLPIGSVPGRINLIGSPNFLKIKGDSVSAYLPYYGERHIAAPYNTNNTGIKFEGTPRNFQMTEDEKTQAYKIEFDISENVEAYTVNITVFPNLKSEIVVNSNQRFMIRYLGDARQMPSE